MPDIRTVTCLRGPRSLPGGRIVEQGATAHDVDIEHTLVADLIDQGALEVAVKPRGRKPTADKNEEHS